MTFPYQLHHKSKEQQQVKQKQTLSSNLKQLEGLPFWIWDKEEHRSKHLVQRKIVALTTF